MFFLGYYLTLIYITHISYLNKETREQCRILIIVKRRVYFYEMEIMGKGKYILHCKLKGYNHDHI